MVQLSMDFGSFIEGVSAFVVTRLSSAICIDEAIEPSASIEALDKTIGRAAPPIVAGSLRATFATGRGG